MDALRFGMWSFTVLLHSTCSHILSLSQALSIVELTPRKATLKEGEEVVCMDGSRNGAGIRDGVLVQEVLWHRFSARKQAPRSLCPFLLVRHLFLLVLVVLGVRFVFRLVLHHTWFL